MAPCAAGGRLVVENDEVDFVAFQKVGDRKSCLPATDYDNAFLFHAGTAGSTSALNAKRR